MALNTQSFDEIVSNISAAIQGAANALVDFTVGSILRAIADATAGVALWLQGLALQIAALTRFATSNDADADSWGADFGFTRLPQQASTGPVTLARFTPTLQAVIPVGTVVQTSDGTVQFQVIADTNQSAYNSGLNAYVINAGISSCSATVRCTTPGSSGNVSAGLISTLGTAVPYVDTVTNASPFSNGADSESDADYKARFPEYLASLSKATPGAIEEAITSIQQDVTFSLTENASYAGVYTPGYFYVVVDDGSGAPSGGFLTAVGNAIDAVRPACSTFGVFAPVVTTVNVSLTIAVAAGYSHGAVAPIVQQAIVDYIDSLAVGADLPFTELPHVAYSASPGVVNVTGILLAGGTADIVADNQHTIRAGTVTVS